jgi:hypothetical protein
MQIGLLISHRARNSSSDKKNWITVRMRLVCGATVVLMKQQSTAGRMLIAEGRIFRTGCATSWVLSWAVIQFGSALLNFSAALKSNDRDKDRKSVNVDTRLKRILILSDNYHLLLSAACVWAVGLMVQVTTRCEQALSDIRCCYGKNQPDAQFCRVYWISLYMLQTVFPSIIRSPRLHTASGIHRTEIPKMDKICYWAYTSIYKVVNCKMHCR